MRRGCCSAWFGVFAPTNLQPFEDGGELPDGGAEESDRRQKEQGQDHLDSIESVQ
jgi:hypothetical protein